MSTISISPILGPFNTQLKLGWKYLGYTNTSYSIKINCNKMWATILSKKNGAIGYVVDYVEIKVGSCRMTSS